MALQSVGIIGAGAWGTALAVTSRRAGRDVLIWAYELETLIDINEAHRNGIYLPGVSLDRAIEATAKFNEVANCDLLLMAAPAQQLRAVAERARPLCEGRPAGGDLLEGHRADDRQTDVAGRGGGPCPPPRSRCCRGRALPPRSRAGSPRP